MNINEDIMPIEETLLTYYKGIKRRKKEFNIQDISYTLSVAKTTIRSNKQVDWQKLVKIMLNLEISRKEKADYIKSLDLSDTIKSNIWDSRIGDW